MKLFYILATHLCIAGIPVLNAAGPVPGPVIFSICC